MTTLGVIKNRLGVLHGMCAETKEQQAENIIKDKHHTIPNPEEITSEIAGARYASKCKVSSS